MFQVDFEPLAMFLYKKAGGIGAVWTRFVLTRWKVLNSSIWK